MHIKSFVEFLNEEETPVAEPKVSEPAEKPVAKAPEPKPASVPAKTEEPDRPRFKQDPKVKDQRLGYTAAGTEIMAKMKVGHTIELTPNDFSKMMNMRVTQYERDMYPHERGGKDYKIEKDADNKCTIFHYNKTLHELTPVGVFELPKLKKA
jgi:hypothetical protein